MLRRNHASMTWSTGASQCTKRWLGSSVLGVALPHSVEATASKHAARGAGDPRINRPAASYAQDLRGERELSDRLYAVRAHDAQGLVRLDATTVVGMETWLSSQ